MPTGGGCISSQSHSAFSLVELLVGLAIIAILSGLSVAAFTSVGRSSSVNGAVDLAASLSLAARLEALSYGMGSKLVIDSGPVPDNPNDVEYKFSRIAIFRAQEDEANPGKKKWVLVGKPLLLPRGVFFLKDYSDGFVEEEHVFIGTAKRKTLVFEFNGSGHLLRPAKLVFSGGVVGTDGRLEFPEAMLAARSGFLLRTNGRPAYFQNADRMPRL
jgi:prepilin-type N-terminal cleavage/methylation domain-containing protein